MTYRERREAEAERLREWAAKREERAAAVFKQGERFHGDFAFNTQPGHIPERARLIAREDRAHESLRKAQSMESRAAGIQTAAMRWYGEYLWSANVPAGASVIRVCATDAAGLQTCQPALTR